ncbi:3-oxoacyl-ACP reductase [Flavobacterium aquiphilum]|uniref:3-oxoacyl-ACP reductase n=1 Tax=Flavobacterium aquiphilum TaxID=3003261 RepID=UPI00247FF439|nr:3-oxoacyl-ACP reductase [Flavobacterium aquiphilum]
MKKATLSIGLLTLVMVLTSFTTPETKSLRIAENTLSSPIDGTQDAGRTRKVDDYMSTQTMKPSIQVTQIDGTQDAGRTRKVD